MKFIKTFWDKTPTFLKNKYVLGLFLFLFWLLLFDNNNLIHRVKGNKKIKQLQQEKEYYIEKINEDTELLNDLKNNKSSIEKYAREQYRMKRPDEDLYYIVEE